MPESHFLYPFVERYISIALSEPRQAQDADGNTKYGTFFGNADAQWCTEFAIWCICKADEEFGTQYVGTYFPYADYAGACVAWHRENGSFYEKGGYIPRRGDLIYFDYDGDGEADHTGLVTGVERASAGGETSILTVEGNIPEDSPNGVVRQRRLHAESNSILGYGSFPVNSGRTG